MAPKLAAENADLAETAAPKAAELEGIVQFVVLTVESPNATPAPPSKAEFDVIVQPTAVMTESPAEINAPPYSAEFEVNVVFLNAPIDCPSSAIAPPQEEAEFELIVLSITNTCESRAYTAPPRTAVLE